MMVPEDQAPTVKEILDADIREIPESQLGKGLVVVRAPSCKTASPGFTPWMDHEAVVQLAGPSTFDPDAEIDAEDLDDANLETDNDPLNGATLPSDQLGGTRRTSGPSTEDESEQASVSPNIERWLKSEDLHIDTLVQAWNAGINTVDGIKTFFRMKQGEAYKAYKRVKDLKKESVSEPESSQE